MKALVTALVLVSSLGDASAAAFYARQEVSASGPTTPPAPPAVIYNDGLPPDGRYSAAVIYAGQVGPFTARGASAIDVDLRTGTFNLSDNAINSCYRSPVCGGSREIFVGAPSSFIYSDTLSVWAPGASATTRNFVEFAFRMTGIVRYNTGVIAPASESIVSSLSLVDASRSLASSASIDRLCAGAGCSFTPTTTAMFDPVEGTFAEALPQLDPVFSNPDDLLRVRIPVYGEYSVLDLSLAMALVDVSARADFTSVLSLVSPGLVVTGTDGYLLQPRAVPEPGMPLFLVGGAWALWSLARRHRVRVFMAKNNR